MERRPLKRSVALLVALVAAAPAGCSCGRGDRTGLLIKLHGTNLVRFTSLGVDVSVAGMASVANVLTWPDGLARDTPTDFAIVFADPVAGAATVCVTAYDSMMMAVDYGCGAGDVKLGHIEKVSVRLYRIVCGDARVQPSEECEPGDTAGQTCETLDFVSGTLGCTPSCTLETSGCVACGNGVRDADFGEDCDTDDLADQTCFSVNAGIGGALACAADCRFDSTACTWCGNEQLDTGEECDGADLNGALCDSLSGSEGSPVCLTDCTVSRAHCRTCGVEPFGVQRVDPGEECEGGDLRNETCGTLGFESGTLRCNVDCTLDTSGCSLCGNLEIDPGEQCDGLDLDGYDCETLPSPPFYFPTGGTLACTGDCRFDTRRCGNCANGVVESDDPCDAMVTITSPSCLAITGSLGGAPLCRNVADPWSGEGAPTSHCEIDASTCTACGDGVCGPQEANYGCGIDCFDCGNGICDPGETCRSCPTDCNTACCGNGVIDDWEECEPGPPPNLGGETCESVGLYTVTAPLGCNPECSFDRSGCGLCGNGMIDPGETCDGPDLGAMADAWTCFDLAGPTRPDGTPTGCTFCQLTNDFPPFATGPDGLATGVCHVCGDGFQDEDEQCDGLDLGGLTCVALGFLSGRVVCNADCTLDCGACTGGSPTGPCPPTGWPGTP